MRPAKAWLFDALMVAAFLGLCYGILAFLDWLGAALLK